MMKQQMFDYEEVEEMATAVFLKRQLETIQRFLFMALGSVLTILLFVLTDSPYISRPVGFLWLMLLLGPPATSLLLLVSPTWRLLPLSKRINPVMAGLSVSWLATVIFYVSSLSGYRSPLWVSIFYLLFIAGYLLLILGVWYVLQRRIRAADESLFP